jgi:hypothetical protein
MNVKFYEIGHEFIEWIAIDDKLNKFEHILNKNLFNIKINTPDILKY